MLPVLLAAVWAVAAPPTGGCYVSQETGWAYCPSAYDYRWLAASVDCEAGREAGGPEGSAVVWALFQRFALTSKRPRSFTRLGSYVQAYSRCVNHAFGSSGPRTRSKSIHARVDHFRSAWPHEISRDARSVVGSWMSGALPNDVPGYVHFDQPPEVGGRRPEGAVGRERRVSERPANVFWRIGRTKDWAPDRFVWVPGPWVEAARTAGRASASLVQRLSAAITRCPWLYPVSPS